ncbi:hypothetical protein AB4072_06295 [Microvirga sp. 2MCAF38]|uniref:hypothetical protein n=1 Tax=Microvirga sp. 2MCAF38 TaxID=3232989 RepID=UPI003F9513DB
MKIFRFSSGAIAALALVGGLAAAEPAAARDRLSPGAAAALGVLGGLAVGGAIAASQGPVYAAPPPRVYVPPPEPVYYAPPPEPAYYPPPPPPPVYVQESCFSERYSEWVPGWGWQPRRRTVCR